MNEGMAVFLNGGEEKSEKPVKTGILEGLEKPERPGKVEGSEKPERLDELISKIDKLLLDCGIKYSGIMNLYTPTEAADRDHAVFAACEALNNAAWLKDRLANISIMNRTDVCPLEQIRLDDMTEPSPGKLKYYEAYYRKSRKLAHGIVVDEERKLRDGYTSYLIARKYGIRPDIYEAFAARPLRKVVRGRHVLPENGTWKIKGSKRYSWTYSLKKAVVPGDILKVQTKKGQMYICVDRIEYVTGEEFCAEHSSVMKHMKERLKV